MTLSRDKHLKHCRWCGTPYWASKPCDKDGFHTTACKQAHYRAYKKYVTATDQAAGDIQSSASRKR